MNKEKRLAVYEKALEIYKVNIGRGVHTGLCCAINDAQNKIFGFRLINVYQYINLFPEIYKHKPKNFGSYWFPSRTKYGVNKRIWILEQAIKELKS